MWSTAWKLVAAPIEDAGGARRPLDVPNGPERADRAAVWSFVGFGGVLRVVVYALNYPLWCDEAFVAANFITRDYADLLRPLDYSQICPLFFLWLELSAVKLLGFSEPALRLLPTAASVAGLFVFAHVSGRVLAGRARVLAVGVFAVAYYPIRHGAEVKPYATDLLSSLVLLALAVEWWRASTGARSRSRWRWVWALAAALPMVLGLSHPAVFVAGGISLALAWPAWRERRRGALAAFAVYNLMLVATFVALFAAFTGGQSRASLETLRSHYWAGAFPPWREPARLVVWLAEAHTGRMFAYPFGEARGASGFTTLCFATGLVFLWRRRETPLLVLTLGPLGLAFAAAILGRYPYGGSVRTMIFAAPSVCLISGLGLAALLARLPRACDHRRAFTSAVVGLWLAGLVVLALNAAWPYKSVADRNSRDFARWFWTEEARGADLACVKTDLGTGFNRRNWLLFRSALYLCNQKICSPRHRDGDPVNRAPASADRPLRCVLYNESPETDPACAFWLRAMSGRYDVSRRATFVVNDPTRADDGTDDGDCYTVIDFVPRTPGVATREGAARRE